MVSYMQSFNIVIYVCMYVYMIKYAYICMYIYEFLFA
jgi:hypothetical protein